MQRPAFSLYDASAGSGKTFTLVKEYLSIILASPYDDAYRHILAITFTNKAVHEMKSRIVSALSDIASPQTSAKGLQILEQISQKIGQEPGVIKEKARRIIRHMIHNYAAFDISTIDKFTHRIIRTFAHDLNLPSTFEVSLDTENLLSEAVDALIARAGDDPTLTRFLVDYTMEKTDSDKSWDVSREIFLTGKLILNENDRTELLHLQDMDIPEFSAIRNRIRESLAELEAQNVQLANSALSLLSHHNVELKSFSRGSFPKYLQNVAQGIDCDPKYDDPDAIQVNKSATDGALIESLKPELVELTGSICRNKGRIAFYRALLQNLTPLSLLNALQKELARIQEEQNVLSISEFNKIINDQIRDQPAPFIYERLGDRYRHFFIDEFQDTSVMQWQNLIPLIDNATSSEELSGERGSVMLVGDPKQSIYRWRGGRAEQFIDLGKEPPPFNNKEREVIALETNWRSHSQVIDFNNDFFMFAATRFTHPDYRELYAAASQKHNDKKGGYVRISFVDPDAEEKQQIYLDAVWETIQNVLAQGFSYGDIAVLTRKKDQGVAVASMLTEKGVQIISSETLLLASSAQVRFLIDFLKLLANPQDLDAKANVLYFIADAHALPIHDFISGGVRLDDADLSARFKAGGFDCDIPALRKKSLYESVESLVRSFVPGGQSSAYVQHFLDLILERETKANSGISEFLEFWRNNGEKFSVPTPPAENAIQIMTVHKAKGLEFPVVIFPFADERFSSSNKNKFWLDATQEDLGLPRVLVNDSKDVATYSDASREFYLQKKQEELLDNINILYVALTRAAEQLYIISSLKLNKDGNPPANSLPELLMQYLEQRQMFDRSQSVYEFGEAVRVSKPSAGVAQPVPIRGVASPMDFKAIRIARRESVMWGTSQQDAIEYGNLVHQLMAWIRTAKDVETALHRAVAEGMIPLGRADQVLASVASIVNHPELAGHFSPANTILNERAILSPGLSTMIPDRVSIVGMSAYLLDYKTGARLAAHEQQLDQYAGALELMGFEVAKKSLVYIGEPVNVVHL